MPLSTVEEIRKALTTGAFYPFGIAYSNTDIVHQIAQHRAQQAEQQALIDQAFEVLRQRSLGNPAAWSDHPELGHARPEPPEATEHHIAAALRSLDAYAPYFNTETAP